MRSESFFNRAFDCSHRFILCAKVDELTGLLPKGMDFFILEAEYFFAFLENIFSFVNEKICNNKYGFSIFILQINT